MDCVAEGGWQNNGPYIFPLTPRGLKHRHHFSVVMAWLVRHSLGLLQLLSPLDGVCLILAPPLGHLSIGLGQQPLQLSLGLGLFFMLLPQEVTIMPQGLHSMGQRTLGLQEPQ